MGLSRYFDIDLGIILKNGRPCTNLRIDWDESDCGNVYCERVPNSTILKVQLPEDCEDTCYYANVTCLDADCVICDTVRIRICPCTDDTDCDACERCINNQCVSICDDGEFCTEDDICGECDSTHPCECNKICVAGKCVCPPNLPYEDSRGCCHECDENHPCDPCFYCTPDGCKPLECICDITTGDCVECINTTDCTLPNECCVDKECVCCTGFVRNPLTGGCDPKKECTYDRDCPECYICVDGDCEPPVIPPGYVLGNKDIGCIVRECDCDSPNCGTNGTCLPYDVNKCYCSPCSGSCTDNGDCGEGCYCDNGQCEPNPCQGPCLTGADCAPGCGCLEGDCVPCLSLGCNNNQECARALGCFCDGNNCEESPCQGPCDSALDCDQDCGCKDQNCEPCSKYPCVTGDDCPEGCYCNSGICAKNPCDTVYCTTPGDCGEDCGCDDGLCVPCSSLSCVSSECSNVKGCTCVLGNCVDDGDDDCTDTLTVSKEDTCKIKGKLVTSECCGCPEIGLHITGSISGNTLNLTGELRKGLTTASTKLGSTGILNEVPLSGTVKITVVTTYNEFDCNSGTLIAGSPQLERREVGTIVFDNTDTASTSGILPTQTLNISGKCYKAISNCVYAEGFVDFVYPNGCTQKFGEYLLFCSPNTVNSVYGFTQKNRCKTPLFTWSKSSDGLTYNTFRRIYSTKTSINNFEDIFGGPEGLEICKYYKLDVDCGCVPSKFYEC